ncbi:hypothetical protein EX30DRAFT_364462 [Ascodesmis nigricans]|uniref:Ecp2 effector protein domain-containing protein n=1 Tax=Ascodesmis nigricans TaxID=341454 RepID=A0A4S2MVI4_9PEZI|nr:hypothetical protein EX30DRAFT_364462 [Ascodesmis nigricans]
MIQFSLLFLVSTLLTIIPIINSIALPAPQAAEPGEEYLYPYPNMLKCNSPTGNAAIPLEAAEKAARAFCDKWAPAPTLVPANDGTMKLVMKHDIYWVTRCKPVIEELAENWYGNSTNRQKGHIKISLVNDFAPFDWEIVRGECYHMTFAMIHGCLSGSNPEATVGGMYYPAMPPYEAAAFGSRTMELEVVTCRNNKC